jgi:dTDP-glucose pyrophosphorylase
MHDGTTPSQVKPLMLIPAAGFGERAGRPLAKEMLLVDSLPMIEWCLSLAEKFSFDPLVVTRKEKTNLLAYLEERKIKYFLAGQTPEWQQTVLAAKHLWREKNLLVLPDTRFSPLQIVKEVVADLSQKTPLVFAVHQVANAGDWGVIDIHSASVRICEKPRAQEGAFAWGLIAFHQEAGEKLFLSLRHNQWLELPYPLKTKKLDDFFDLTR